MTSLEREDTCLGNTGPIAVRTVFERKVFIVPTMGSFRFFSFSRISNAVERRPTRKIRIFVSHTWREKLVNFSRILSMIRFDSMTGTVSVIDNFSAEKFPRG